MNKDLYRVLKENHLHIKSIDKKGKVYIIKDENHVYVIKLNTNNYDIYKYLLSRDFINFPENLNQRNDNYDISLYIEDVKTLKNQKVEDLLRIISLLHNKTAYTREIDLDEIKEIYEELNNKIKNTKEYYLKLNDNIDSKIFFSPSEYLLVRNISLIYYLLEYSNKLLNEWYINIKEDKTIRVALLHNNISIDHLIINNNLYLISWDKAYFNSPIYDIEEFYRKYYSDIKLNDMFKIYNEKNKLNILEKKLLLVKLSIPKIINLSNNTYLDCKKIYEEITFLNKINEFIRIDNIKKE